MSAIAKAGPFAPLAHRRLSPKRAPAPSHKTDDTQARGDDVYRDKHPEEQRVIDKCGGAWVDPDRRDRTLCVLHEIKQGPAQHEVELEKKHASSTSVRIGAAIALISYLKWAGRPS